MGSERNPVTVGFLKIRNEPEEVRDFLPSLAGVARRAGAEVLVESGCGSGMGYKDADYDAIEGVHIAGRAEVLAADIVLVLRPPPLDELVPGTTLVSMLHFATRTARAVELAERGVEAVALDLIVDDDGRRLVENMEAVAWNGLHAAFKQLQRSSPRYFDPSRKPIRVTILGTGMVGKHAVEAAVKFGDPEQNQRFMDAGMPGAEARVFGRNLTADEPYVRAALVSTDILVDATFRNDTSRTLIPNAWLEELPTDAVICDLAVDPYLLDEEPLVVRGIEGIPGGDLGQYVFEADDPAWDERVPAEIPNDHRRAVVSCYSWPGILPEPCMWKYGRQLAPPLEKLIAVKGARLLSSDGDGLERALLRGSLRSWVDRIAPAA